MCSSNERKNLYIVAASSLTSLDSGTNRLTELDVSQMTSLRTLQCDNNLLKNLDVRWNTKLETLTSKENQLTSLDLTRNRALTRADCTKNGRTVYEGYPVSSLKGLNMANVSSISFGSMDGTITFQKRSSGGYYNIFYDYDTGWVLPSA